jgi:hypothetical protein
MSMRRTSALIAALFNLVALPVAQSSEGSARAGSYSLELVGEGGSVLPTFRKGGRTYVLGALGQRYSLRLRNGSGQRVEFVASVDGRDVLDGRLSAWENRGYIVDPYREVVIDGFRLSNESVAAFRFSSVQRSYAARLGDARDVGVIGVAVFAERQQPVIVVPPHWNPWGNPSDRAASGAPGNGAARDEFHGAAQSPPAAAEPLAEQPGKAARKSFERPGLGTEFGEQRMSRAYETQFERASSQPEVVLSLRYDDREGLIAMGIDVGCRGDAALRETADPFRRDSRFSPPPPGWSGR